MTFIKDSFKKSGNYFDKNIHPSETLLNARKKLELFSPPLLKASKRIDKGRLGIPVYVSRYSPYASKITGSLKQMGKGGTPEQAEASAVMELAERFSVFSFCDNGKRQFMTLKEITGNAITLEEILESVNAQAFSANEMDYARELLDIMPLDWVKGYNIQQDKTCWLPWSWFWKINEYNGSAAGNSFEEASVQALCEVVERHVCSIISYANLTTSTIDLSSVHHPAAKELLEKFQKKGIHFTLKDFSMDLSVPTVGIIAWDPSTFPKRSEIVYTAGTAPEPERALIRAITEVAQLAGDFDTDGKYLESGLPKFFSIEETSYVMESPSSISMSALPDCSSDNFKIEIENISCALRKAGLCSYLVDVTHSELMVPSAYAIIPGNQFRDRTKNIDIAFHCSRLAADIPDKYFALSVLEHIERLYPESPDSLFYMGFIYEQLGNFKDATYSFQRSLDLNPSSLDKANIRCHLGLCYKEMNEIDQALKELEAALLLNPALKDAHNLMGYCLYRKKDHVSAIEAFEKAISIDPGSAIDYANIAVNLRCMGMAEMAKRWYEMAVDLDPEITWAKEHLMEIQAK